MMSSRPFVYVREGSSEDAHTQDAIQSVSINFLKFVLIGDEKVGKSCLASDFADSAFQDQYVSTIGADFKVKDIRVGAKAVKIQVWDSSGQKKYRDLQRAFYQGSDQVFIVFDLTNQESFNHVRYWTQEVVDSLSKPTSFILIGTKADLVEKQVVDRNAIIACVRELKIAAYIETSAKAGVGIKDAFEIAAKLALVNISLADAIIKQRAARASNKISKTIFIENLGIEVRRIEDTTYGKATHNVNKVSVLNNLKLQISNALDSHEDLAAIVTSFMQERFAGDDRFTNYHIVSLHRRNGCLSLFNTALKTTTQKLIDNYYNPQSLISKRLK